MLSTELVVQSRVYETRYIATRHPLVEPDEERPIVAPAVRRQLRPVAPVGQRARGVELRRGQRRDPRGGRRVEGGEIADRARLVDVLGPVEVAEVRIDAIDVNRQVGPELLRQAGRDGI